jgi:hypothetical protein
LRPASEVAAITPHLLPHLIAIGLLRNGGLLSRPAAIKAALGRRLHGLWRWTATTAAIKIAWRSRLHGLRCRTAITAVTTTALGATALRRCLIGMTTAFASAGRRIGQNRSTQQNQCGS